MITIERKQPTFVARAVGIITGTLTPSSDGRSATITTDDAVTIPAFLHDRAISILRDNPALFVKRLDLLVWPRTTPYDLEVIVINLEAATKVNPDRDQFLIQGVSLRNKPNGRISKIGIRNNSSDRDNTSVFNRFWLNLHGHLTDNLPNTIYQVKAVRRGKRLFIIESNPHIKTGKRWKLLSQERRSTKPGHSKNGLATTVRKFLNHTPVPTSSVS